MRKFIVIIRERASLKPQIVEESVSEAAAEDLAQDLYRDEGLDMVMVAEVCKDIISETGMRLRSVLKIERKCKHPNIQGEFLPRKGNVCMGCGMEIKPLKVRSIFERTLQATA